MPKAVYAFLPGQQHALADITEAGMLVHGGAYRRRDVTDGLSDGFDYFQLILDFNPEDSRREFLQAASPASSLSLEQFAVYLGRHQARMPPPDGRIEIVTQRGEEVSGG